MTSNHNAWNVCLRTRSLGWAFALAVWSYVTSLGLAEIVATQAVLSRGCHWCPSHRIASVRESLASLITAVKTAAGLHQPTEQWAVLTSIACRSALILGHRRPQSGVAESSIVPRTRTSSYERKERFIYDPKNKSCFQ